MVVGKIRIRHSELDWYTGVLGEGGADHGALSRMQLAQFRLHIHP